MRIIIIFLEESQPILPSNFLLISISARKRRKEFFSRWGDPGTNSQWTLGSLSECLTEGLCPDITPPVDRGVIFSRTLEFPSFGTGPLWLALETVPESLGIAGWVNRCASNFRTRQGQGIGHLLCTPLCC